MGGQGHAHMGWSWLTLSLRSAVVTQEMGGKLLPGDRVRPWGSTLLMDAGAGSSSATFHVHTQDPHLNLRFTLGVGPGMAALSCSWVMREP